MRDENAQTDYKCDKGSLIFIGKVGNNCGIIVGIIVETDKLRETLVFLFLES